MNVFFSLGVDENAVTTQKPYHIYYGIPFAEPPLGNLRFRPPRRFTAKSADQIINSDKPHNACIQNEGGLGFSQSEDCLFLNVFTPRVENDADTFDTTSRKKVMFWIHGGGFTMGDAVADRFSRLVTDFDVIAVTAQYRLGPFGFLSTGDDVVPGNNALKDLIMALEWIKDNIQRFGGDPYDVTIFGVSAGGACASALALSPLTKGLFTKVILQSGTILSSWAMRSNPEKRLRVLAENTNCLPTFQVPVPGISFSEYNREIINCLSKVSAQELHQAYAEMDLSRILSDENAVFNFESPVDILNLKEIISFGPNVDGEVLPRQPESLLADKNYMQKIGALDRDYIIGFTNKEGILYVNLMEAMGMSIDNMLDDNFFQRALLKNSQSMFHLSALSTDVLNFVSMEYAFPRDWQGKPQLNGLIDLVSDTGYIIPAIQFTRALVNLSTNVNVYSYVFDHYPELKDPNGLFRGSSHGLDSIFLLDEMNSLPDLLFEYASVWTPRSLPLMDIYRGVFANFAKTGNPSLAGRPAWPRYDLKDERFMSIDTEPSVGSHMYARRISLWTDFLPRVMAKIASNGPGRSPYRV